MIYKSFHCLPDFEWIFWYGNIHGIFHSGFPDLLDAPNKSEYRVFIHCDNFAWPIAVSLGQWAVRNIRKQTVVSPGQWTAGTKLKGIRG